MYIYIYIYIYIYTHIYIAHLALLELGLVVVLEANARVHLVNLDAKVVTDALHRQVLPGV